MRRLFSRDSCFALVLAVVALLECSCNVISPSKHYDANENVERFLSSTDNGNVKNAETEHSLFGSVDALNAVIGTVAIVIIIAAVQLVEYLFHSLHGLTHDTPFEQMVATIEKELMIVGCTAFIFKIIINVKHFLSTDWFYALEYAGAVLSSLAC